MKKVVVLDNAEVDESQKMTPNIDGLIVPLENAKWIFRIYAFATNFIVVFCNLKMELFQNKPPFYA